MRCLYSLTPTSPSTQHISEDLQDVGASDFFLNVMTKDDAAERKQAIHSSNCVETVEFVEVVRDMLRDRPADLAAIQRHVIDPLSGVARRPTSRARERLSATWPRPICANS